MIIRRLSIEIVRVFLIVITGIMLYHSTYALRSFNNDCSANARLKCRVQEGTCENNTQSEDYPSAPHELRVSPYLIAPAHGRPDSYQLWVNISWRPTYEKSINRTEGFEMNIIDKDAGNEMCFTFYLESPQWDDKDRDNSIRFQFSTINIFDYNHHYIIDLQSLPKPIFNSSKPKKSNSISMEITTPVHPEHFLLEQLNETGYFDFSTPTESMTAHCKPQSSTDYDIEHGSGAHPHAHQWVAAFRYVYIHPKLNLIFVDFVAAPAQYCFEEYELRLLKDTHHVISRTRIRSEDLYREIHGNVSVAFGNYTFRNVTPGIYDIGVIPIDRSRLDSRCLCPAFGRICTCKQAIWPDVIMPAQPVIPGPPANPCDQLPPVGLPFDCPTDNNTVKIDIEDRQIDKTIPSNLIGLICLLIGALLFLVAACLFMRRFYKRFKKKASTRMYILPFGTTAEFDLKSGDSDTFGREMSHILHPTNVLVIYSHDCAQHEAAVEALCDYLSANCLCRVNVDYLCYEDIAANKYDWVYKSILEADRILLINSYGAYIRYQAKLISNHMINGRVTNGHPINGHLINDRLTNGHSIDNHVITDISNPEKPQNGKHPASIMVERADAGPYDDLFLLQLDLITQCQQRDPKMGSKLTSVRFSYSPAQMILPHVNPYKVYEIPQHLRSLVMDMHKLHIPMLHTEDDGYEVSESSPVQLRNVNVKDYDKCEVGDRMKKCIESMKSYINDTPNWFELLHIRRPATILRIPTLSPSKKPPSPSRTRCTKESILADEEQLESLLPDCIVDIPFEFAPTKPASAADSGYNEPGVSTSDGYMDNVLESRNVAFDHHLESRNSNTPVIDSSDQVVSTNLDHYPMSSNPDHVLISESTDTGFAESGQFDRDILTGNWPSTSSDYSKPVEGPETVEDRGNGYSNPHPEFVHTNEIAYTDLNEANENFIDKKDNPTKSSMNLDSCDSGISADYGHRMDSFSGLSPSPKTKARNLNGYTKIASSKADAFSNTRENNRLIY